MHSSNVENYDWDSAHPITITKGDAETNSIKIFFPHNQIISAENIKSLVEIIAASARAVRKSEESVFRTLKMSEPKVVSSPDSAKTGTEYQLSLPENAALSDYTPYLMNIAKAVIENFMTKREQDGSEPVSFSDEDILKTMADEQKKKIIVTQGRQDNHIEVIFPKALNINIGDIERLNQIIRWDIHRKEKIKDDNISEGNTYGDTLTFINNGKEKKTGDIRFIIRLPSGQNISRNLKVQIAAVFEDFSTRVEEAGKKVQYQKILESMEKANRAIILDPERYEGFARIAFYGYKSQTIDAVRDIIQKQLTAYGINIIDFKLLNGSGNRAYFYGLSCELSDNDKEAERLKKILKDTISAVIPRRFNDTELERMTRISLHAVIQNTLTQCINALQQPQDGKNKNIDGVQRLSLLKNKVEKELTQKENIEKAVDNVLSNMLEESEKIWKHGKNIPDEHPEAVSARKKFTTEVTRLIMGLVHTGKFSNKDDMESATRKVINALLRSDEYHLDKDKSFSLSVRLTVFGHLNDVIGEFYNQRER